MAPTAEQVRTEVRAWIEENFDPQLRLRDWLERLADSGWAAPTWPEQWYGKGLSNDLAAVAFEEFRAIHAPGPPAGLSRMLAAPTIISHGSDEQKRRYVRAILVGEQSWCQLFSEPGAGSDLASLQTRAERDGEEYIVNGQKVWTSGGLGADMGMLLARTDPDVPKHRGITWFAFEMDQPGVEVRPLKQMTGEAHFAEVFFTDARVPAANIVGELNAGWGVALTTLANERVGLGAGGSLGFAISAPGGSRVREQLDATVGEYVESVRRAATGRTPAMLAARGPEAMIRLARELGRETDPQVRQQIARLHTLTQLNRLNGLRARAAAQAGGRPGPEGSLGKLMVSHITRLSRDLGMQIAGAYGMLAGADGPLDGALALQFLGAPAPSIYGGSDEIQHNIIGERVLGLPREPDVSKDVPFRQLKVGTQASA